MSQQWGEPLVLGVLALAVIGLVLAFFVNPRQGRRIAVLALLSPAALAFAGWEHMHAEANAAPLPDVSTDLVDPPAYTDAVHNARARIAGGNGVDFAAEKTPDGRAFADVQRHVYPAIVSIPTGLVPLQAFALTKNLRTNRVGASRCPTPAPAASKRLARRSGSALSMTSLCESGPTAAAPVSTCAPPAASAPMTRAITRGGFRASWRSSGSVYRKPKAARRARRCWRCPARRRKSHAVRSPA